MDRVRGLQQTGRCENGMTERRRMLIYVAGASKQASPKTAISLLRYCPREVTGLLDPENVGKTAAELFGVGGALPVVGSVETAPADTNMLTLGMAPVGGKLPASWMPPIEAAVSRGWDVLAGTHDFLSNNARLRQLAASSGSRLIDARKPPDALGCNGLGALKTRAVRVLTVGTDCDIGKMTVAWELHRALQARGLNTGFAATGQTGIMVSGGGIAVDAVVADYIAGAAEQLVVAEAARDVVVVEGQGSISSPLYSGVSLGLLHGVAPDAMILCHDPWRTAMVGTPDWRVPDPAESVAWHENVAAMVHPAKVVGIAINGRFRPVETVRARARAIAAQTGLPTTDVLAMGSTPLVQALHSVCEGVRPLEEQ